MNQVQLKNPSMRAGATGILGAVLEMCNKGKSIDEIRYIDSQRDITLKWRGSSNQKVIDVQESLRQNKYYIGSNEP